MARRRGRVVTVKIRVPGIKKKSRRGRRRHRRH